MYLETQILARVWNNFKNIMPSYWRCLTASFTCAQAGSFMYLCIGSDQTNRIRDTIYRRQKSDRMAQETSTASKEHSHLRPVLPHVFHEGFSCARTDVRLVRTWGPKKEMGGGGGRGKDGFLGLLPCVESQGSSKSPPGGRLCVAVRLPAFASIIRRLTGVCLAWTA
jgi:hypothetical protein